ncbi:MAG: UDP-N-acetylmuramate--L-alanine ligase [Flavobacteriales bacterium]|nr:UDP-N-acetylmuramate--L-alanine ligase [Flavobacteriales bacterium]
MNLKEIKTIYMLGIGGIGMSALARFFHRQGVNVSGYDKTPSVLTDELIQEGIPVHFEESIYDIPKGALYVYTPAIPSDHRAFEYVKHQGGTWYKRSEVLEEVTRNTKTIAIAGTHGKTTTTAITAHLLHTVAGNCSAFVGGVMTGYGSNLIAADDPMHIVVEADEYDRSFLRLHPNIAVITSLDPDHLDVYGSFEEMKKDYRAFAARAELLIVNEKVATEFEHSNKVVYGKQEGADHRFFDVRVENGSFVFSFDQQQNLHLALPGAHNVENASAALSVTAALRLEEGEVAEALSSFAGVKRRFERVYSSDHKVVIDDYAHHPEEIKAAIDAARQLYPTKKLAVVFQPHLFSRTRDLEDGFASSLSLADEVILIPIYPARERPIEGVSSAHLLKKLTLKTKQLVEKSDLVLAVLSLSAEVVLILGAGDIDRFVDPIAKAFEQEHHVD